MTAARAIVRVQAEAFDPGAEINAFTKAHPGAGGITTFLGQVRGTNKAGQSLTAMTLEHYPGMTEKQLEDISLEAHTRWDLSGTLIIHRFGRLEPDDPIVLVCAASAHRADAFNACEFLIDYLKTRAPFWKSEETQAGDTSWVEAKDSDADRAKRWDE